MGAKKKEYIRQISRNEDRYTIFDNSKYSHIEKEKTFYLFLKDYDFKPQIIEIEKKEEFINIKNYENFIDDVKEVINISNRNKNQEDRIKVEDIIIEIDLLKWDVKKIKDYLDRIEIVKGHSLLSFIHIQNFTETIIKYPYDSKDNLYQKHITPLVEIDFKHSLDDVKKYIEKIYNNLTIERKKYEAKSKIIFAKRIDFNFGDCLFTYDAIRFNYTLKKIEEEINTFRVDRLIEKNNMEYKKADSLTEKISQKKITQYIRDLKKEGYKVEKKPIRIIPSFEA